jgi:hypothetical protein
MLIVYGNLMMLTYFSRIPADFSFAQRANTFASSASAQTIHYYLLKCRMSAKYQLTTIIYVHYCPPATEKNFSVR